MPDREKVIKEFEHLLNETKGDHQDFVDLTVDGGEEILSLLKEQKAVEPITMQRIDGDFSFFVPYFLCGNCRYELSGHV